MQTYSKRIGLFLGLSVLLLALVPLLSLVTGASMDFDASAERATAQTGVEQTSSLITVIRLAIAEPSLWLLVLGSAVPALAAILTCVLVDRSSLRGLISRFKPYGSGVSVSSALKTYSAMFILIPICLVCAYFLRSVFPGPVEYSQPDNMLTMALLPILLSAGFLDQGGVLEELGWRGYAQPVLQTVYTPLKAALLIGLFWGLWHVPQHIFSGVIGRLGVFEYIVQFLPSFLLGTITVSIIAAFFINKAGGSVVPAIVIHGLANDAPGLAGVANLQLALTPYHQLSKYFPFLILALILVGMYGKNLGCERE